MISLEAGLLRAFQFTWPPEMVGQDNANVAQAVIVMRRQDGVLLALPVGFLPVDVLQRAATDGGEDWDFGPHFMLTTPAHREDGQPVPLGLEVEVLVIDVSGGALAGLENLSIDGVTASFLEDPSIFPEPQVLLKKTKEWLLNQTAARVGFYSGRRVGPRDTNRRGVGRGAGGGARGPRPSKGSSGKAEESYHRGLGGAAGVCHSTFASVGDSNGEPSEESGCFEGSNEFSTAYCSSSAQSAAGVYVAAGVCKDDGHSAPCEVSDAFSNSRGQVAVGSEDGLNYVNPGAGGRGGPSGRFHVGPCSFGAEQGPHNAGGSTSEWRGSIVRCAIQFLRILPRLKGIYGQTAAADRTGKQIWSFLLAGHSECGSEDETGCQGPGGCCLCGILGFFDGELLGKIRWLRRLSRARPGAILPCSYLRRCASFRPGRRERAPGSDNGSCGAVGARCRPMGPCLSTDSFGGSTFTDVGIQIRREPEPTSSGVCPVVSSKMGDCCTCLPERSRLHSEPSDRSSQRPTFSRSRGCTYNSISKEEEQEPKGEGSRVRGAAGQVRCGRVRGYVPLSQSSREDEFKKVEEEFRHFAGGSELSFPAWADGQVRRILASRTPFSFYLVQAIIGCRGGRYGSPSTALFPIPLPCLKVWESACGRGMKSRVARACQKLLHLAVLALNFEYLSQPLSTLSLLRRPPAVHHLRLYGRLLGFIKASTAIEKISFLGCGRKSHQFSARIEELLVALTKIGVASATHYGGSVAGVRAPLNNEAREELMPYTTLDPSRLKLTGRGQWACEDFLGDLFWLVFKEPRVNRFSLVPPSEGVPDVSREDPVRIFDLCRLWDRQGLLVLCPEEELQQELQLASRVFNCRKNSLVDRQIGDRRAANSVEGRLSGESKCLPAGPNLLQLHPLRYREILVGACTDRKDFYHQFAVTWERATSNFLLPGFKAEDFAGFAAHDRLLMDFGRKERRDREKTGDLLVGGVDPLHPPRSSLLVDDASRVVPCFGSLFQGDHLGVEFASEAHFGLLFIMVCSLRPQGWLLRRPSWMMRWFKDYTLTTSS